MKKLLAKLLFKAVIQAANWLYPSTSWMMKKVDHQQPHSHKSSFYYSAAQASFHLWQWLLDYSRELNDKYQLPYWQKVIHDRP